VRDAIEDCHRPPETWLALTYIEPELLEMTAGANDCELRAMRWTWHWTASELYTQWSARLGFSQDALLSKAHGQKVTFEPTILSFAGEASDSGRREVRQDSVRGGGPITPRADACSCSDGYVFARGYFKELPQFTPMHFSQISHADAPKPLWPHVFARWRCRFSAVLVKTVGHYRPIARYHCKTRLMSYQKCRKQNILLYSSYLSNYMITHEHGRSQIHINKYSQWLVQG